MKAVLTTYSDEYRQKGFVDKMLSTFLQFWPDDVHIYLYHEEPSTVDDYRIHYRPLLKLCPGLVEFKRRNSKKDGYQGGRYNYNFNAAKFAAKSYAVIHGVTHIDADKIYVFGVDTLTFRPITHNVLDAILPDGYFSSFLGRNGYHSETDFIAFAPRDPLTELFFSDWEDYYRKETIFQLPYWHDCGIYDALRGRYKDSLKFHNLTPKAAKTDHVFIKSILGDFMDHMKGPKRKAAGRSFKSDLGPVVKEHGYFK